MVCVSTVDGPAEQPLTIVRAALDVATEEGTPILTEVYERAGNWRVRAVGQGYSTDLAVLARSYGVEVSD
ncbi:TerD family protein [Nocardia otitidiscaviarum]|nr:TerD family protein [Nocardia otitidiscaviarum]